MDPAESQAYSRPAVPVAFSRPVVELAPASGFPGPYLREDLAVGVENRLEIKRVDSDVVEGVAGVVPHEDRARPGSARRVGTRGELLGVAAARRLRRVGHDQVVPQDGDEVVGPDGVRHRALIGMQERVCIQVEVQKPVARHVHRGEPGAVEAEGKAQRDVDRDGLVGHRVELRHRPLVEEGQPRAGRGNVHEREGGSARFALVLCGVAGRIGHDGCRRWGGPAVVPSWQPKVRLQAGGTRRTRRRRPRRGACCAGRSNRSG